jgi:hypothetical protein
MHLFAWSTTKVRNTRKEGGREGRREGVGACVSLFDDEMY